MTDHDFGPAILRALAIRPMTKPALIKYLGAQDDWDAIDAKLQEYREASLIEYVKRKWRLVESVPPDAA